MFGKYIYISAQDLENQLLVVLLYIMVVRCLWMTIS